MTTSNTSHTSPSPRASRKVALITGASSGIGKETAKLLHEKGYIVFAGARRVDQMRDLASAGIIVQRLDVTDEESNKNFVSTALRRTHRIDILVNSAGYGSFGALEDVPMPEARQQLEVNVFGAMRLTQLVLPTMRAQHRGKIINVSSVGGRIYSQLGGWYYASKHALETLSDSLRLEVKNFGIDVIIIEPGGTNTGWQAVTAEKMQLATPADSPYRAMVDAAATLDDSSYVSPRTIAELIWKSVQARRLKTRYLPGLGEKAAVLATRLLPYSVLDRALSAALRWGSRPSKK